MRARRARDFREFSPVRGSGPVRVLVRPVTGTYCAPASSTLTRCTDVILASAISCIPASSSSVCIS